MHQRSMNKLLFFSQVKVRDIKESCTAELIPQEFSTWPCSVYPEAGLFGFFFQPEQCFSLTTIQLEQCFSVSFSQNSTSRTGPFGMDMTIFSIAYAVASLTWLCSQT